MNAKVDAYFSSATRWQAEMKKLRRIVLGCPLTEALKWGKPCYAFHNSNVVLIIGFKAYCSLLFCKGVLLKDPEGLLIKAGENTQAARQIRFTDIREIVKREAILKAYIQDAVEVEKAGLEVDYKQSAELKFPEEFQKKLDGNSALKRAFDALTPGRRRAYNIYFSAAKQSKTREARVEKCMKRILSGKGMND